MSDAIETISSEVYNVESLRGEIRGVDELNLGELVDRVEGHLQAVLSLEEGAGDVATEEYEETISALGNLIRGADPFNRLLQFEVEVPENVPDGDPGSEEPLQSSFNVEEAFRTEDEYTAVERAFQALFPPAEADSEDESADGSDETSPEGVAETLTRQVYEEWRKSLREVLLVLDYTAAATLGEDNSDRQKTLRERTLEFAQRFVASEAPSIDDIDPSPGQILHTTFSNFADRLVPTRSDVTEDNLLGNMADYRQARFEAINVLVRESGVYERGKTPWIQSSTLEVTLTPEEAAAEQRARERGENDTVAWYREQRKLYTRSKLRELEEDPTTHVVNTWGRDPDGSLPISVQEGILGWRKRRLPPSMDITMEKRQVVVKKKVRGKMVREVVSVWVCDAELSEVRPRNPDNPYGTATRESPYQVEAVSSYAGEANSVVKAQEMLWTLEEAKKVKTPDGKIYYQIPGTVYDSQEECLIPISKKDWDTWKRHLQDTVHNFEGIGLSYLDVKRQQEIDALVNSIDPESLTRNYETHLDQVEGDPELAWYYSHLQLIGLEDALAELTVSDKVSYEGGGEHISVIRDYLRAYYSLFLENYGNYGDYSQIALQRLENLAIQGDYPSGEIPLDVVEALVSEVAEEFGRLRFQLAKFSAREIKRMDELVSRDDALTEGEVGEWFLSVVNQFGIGDDADPESSFLNLFDLTSRSVPAPAAPATSPSAVPPTTPPASP